MPPRHLRRRHAARFSWCTLGLTAVFTVAASSTVHAQSAPAVPAATPATELSAAERAKRDADKVFQWIRIMSDKPRKPGTAAIAPEKEKPAAASPTPARVATKPLAKPSDNGIVEKTEPLAVGPSPSAKASLELPAAQADAATAASGSRSNATSLAAASTSAAPAAAPAVVIDEDVPLVPVVKTDPEFPGALMRSLRKGMVQVSFTVQPDGSVSQARAVSSTHPRLVAAAVSTVSQWRFQPVRHPQDAVVDLGFNLD